MSVRILFRNTAQVNIFSDAICQTLTANGIGNEALICSGFFQENFKGHYFRASQEKQLAASASAGGKHITTVGIHNHSWLNSYRNFAISMRNAGVNLTAMRMKGYRWHSKVYIVRKKKKSVFGIVGSSNFTRTAFGTSTDFNYESDVMIWDNRITKLNTLVLSILSERKTDLGIMNIRYKRSDNGGLHECEYLDGLYSRIMKSDLQELK